VSTLRAVLFDLGNTLVDYYPAPEFPAVLRACLRRSLAAAGVAPIDSLVEEAVERAEPLRRERPDHAVLPLERRLRVILEGFGVGDDERLARAADAFLEPIFARARLNPAAWAVLDALRGRGLGLAIVSNTPWGSPAGPWRGELRRLGLLERVDAAVFCADVGWRKPHAAPFVRALEQIGADAADALFVGDDPRWDIAGARGVGMRSLLLEPGSAVGSESGGGSRSGGGDGPGSSGPGFPGAEFSGPNTSDPNTSGPNTSGPNTSDTDSCGTNSSGTDPSGPDPSGGPAMSWTSIHRLEDVLDAVSFLGG
jgi:putative hydrolase of the HAD superfamily